MANRKYSATLITLAWSLQCLSQIAAQPLSGLTFVAKLAEYQDVVYTSRAIQPSQWLFYETEPVVLAFEIGNRTDADQELAIDDLDVQRAFDMSWAALPAGGSRPSVSVR